MFERHIMSSYRFDAGLHFGSFHFNNAQQKYVTGKIKCK